jgi:hypothetical protein
LRSERLEITSDHAFDIYQLAETDALVIFRAHFPEHQEFPFERREFGEFRRTCAASLLHNQTLYDGNGFALAFYGLCGRRVAFAQAFVARRFFRLLGRLLGRLLEILAFVCAEAIGSARRECPIRLEPDSPRERV